MRFSLVFDLSSRDGEGYSRLLDLVQLVDDGPIRAVWIPADGRPGRMDPAVFGAAVAVRTHSLGIRAYRVRPPRRDTRRFVESWAAVQSLAEGRLEVAFAAVHGPVRAGVGTIERLRDEIQHAAADTRVRSQPGRGTLPVWAVAGTLKQWRRAYGTGSSILTTTDFLDSDGFRRWSAVRTGGPVRIRPSVAAMTYAFLAASDDEATGTTSEPLRRHLGRTIRDESARHRAVRDLQNRSGLIGSLHTLTARVEHLAARNVDEIACMVDFGVDADATEQSIHYLHTLAERFSDGPRW
jgi:hypothetical protein